MDHPSTAWQRLGDLIVARRIALDPAYRSRRAFCQATGTEERLLSDIERGRRTNYSPETVARFELALQWQPGSIRAILEGHDPAPLAQNVSGSASMALTGSAVAHGSEAGARWFDETPEDLPEDVADMWDSMGDAQRQIWHLPLSVEERSWIWHCLVTRRNLIALGEAQAEARLRAGREGGRRAG